MSETYDVLGMGAVSVDDLVYLGIIAPDMDPYVVRQIEIQLKYEGYIGRQTREANQFQRMEKVLIPDDLDYDNVEGLSRELRESLKSVRPRSLGQVSRMPGITSRAVATLFKMGRDSINRLTAVVLACSMSIVYSC